jgi:hypothetical protein
MTLIYKKSIIKKYKEIKNKVSKLNNYVLKLRYNKTQTKEKW